MSEDPIGFEGGDQNFYQYCGNNPINKIDPSGKVDLNLFPADDPIRNWATYVGGAWNTYTVGGHGVESIVEDENRRIITPQQLADRIKSDPNYKPWMPVELLICNAGMVGENNKIFAQELANVLATDVIATKDNVNYTSGSQATYRTEKYDYGLGKPVADKYVTPEKFTPQRNDDPCQ